MSKILLGLVFVSVVSIHAPTASAADVASPKVVSAKLQKMQVSSQKSVYGQFDRIFVLSREKNDKSIHSTAKMSADAQIGLLLTALLCFVVRANRRKI
jgi:hypothetical protein